MTYLCVYSNPARDVVYYGTTEIAPGGHARVFKGFDTARRAIVIKVMNRVQAGEAHRAWFNDQYLHLRTYESKFIVKSYDQFQTAGGEYVLVMEAGERSVEDVIVSGRPQSVDVAILIGTNVLCALFDVHNNAAIHRDVKPRNVILFPGGWAKLTDFGVAKVLGECANVARTMLGTNHYLPPEVLRESRWSRQSDIYQTGLVMMSLMLGRHVIDPTLPERTIYQLILDGYPRQLVEQYPQFFPDIGHILRRMVCRTESYRYANAVDVWTDLDTVRTRRRNAGLATLGLAIG
jgi:serine/threonine-protein kinase